MASRASGSSTRCASTAAGSPPATIVPTTCGSSPCTESGRSIRWTPLLRLDSVDFVRYAESSAALLNAELTDRDSVVAHLAERTWLQSQVTDRDAVVLRRFSKDLRPAF